RIAECMQGARTICRAPILDKPASPSARSNGCRQPRVIREIADQRFTGLTLRDSLHEVFATDEATLPRLADAAKRFVAITARTHLIDADLKRTHLRSDLPRGLFVVAANT